MSIDFDKPGLGNFPCDSAESLALKHDGLRLIRSFRRIADQAARDQVIALAESLAGPERPSAG